MTTTVLVQAGHQPPLDPDGPHPTETGTPGEAAFTWALQERLVRVLSGDARLASLPVPGKIEPHTHADIALFLHADAAPAADASTTRGFHFGYPPASAPSKNFVAKLRQELAKLADHPPDLGPGKDNDSSGLSMYYGYDRVDSPVEVVVEHGFMTNADDRRWLLTHVGDLAFAEYAAICGQLNLPPTAAPMPDTNLSSGMKGGDVAVLQVRLNDLGYGQLAEDGAFGDGTKRAVVRFQEDHKLTPADGVVGAATRKALADAVGAPGPRVLKLTSPPIEGEDVKQLQQRLDDLGYGPVPVDGVFAASTDAAVRMFQGEHHLGADGVVGQETRAALASAKPRPTVAATTADPMIKLGSGAAAPTLSYNVPDETSYDGRNFIELKIDPKWFKAYVSTTGADVAHDLVGPSILFQPIDNVPRGDDSFPTDGTNDRPTISLELESPMDGATVRGKLPDGAVIQVSGKASIASGPGGVGSVTVKIGEAAVAVTPAAPGNWSHWTATAKITTPGIANLPIRVVATHDTEPDVKKTSELTVVADVAPAGSPRPADGTPPAVTIVEPANNVALVAPEGGRHVAVRGRARDDAGKVARVEVAVGSGPWVPATLTPEGAGESATWQTEVELALGEHSIAVRATDDAHNTSPSATATVRVVKEAPRPPKTLRLLLVEAYRLSHHPWTYGAGRVLKTLTLLPGEELKLFVKTYTSSEETLKDARSIVDSWTQDANDEFETTTQNEQTYKDNFNETEKYEVSGKAAANWGWGSASISAGYSAGTNSSREELSKNVLNAVRKHAAKASAARNVQVTAEHDIKTTTGEESTSERSIKNINVSRTLNVVARQMLQEYVSILALTDVRLAYVREDVVDRPDGTPESRWAYHEVTLPQLDALIAEFFVDDPDVRRDLRDQIVHQLEHVWNYEDQHRSAVEEAKLAGPDGKPVRGASYLRFPKRLVDQYVDPSEPDTAPLLVPGIIVGATKTTMRTAAVVLDAFLGGGIALDTYSQSLQTVAIEARKIANEASQTESEKSRLAAELVATKNAEGAKIFEQVYEVLRPLPPEDPDANGKLT